MKKSEEKCNTKKSLRWSMVRMLLFGWFFPLLVLILIMVFLVTDYNYKQVENTVLSSLEKASDIMQMQLKACEVASKNASYMEVIEESYLKFCQDGNRSNLKDSVENFLRQQYKYDDNCKAAEMMLIDNTETVYYALNNSNGGTYQDIILFQMKEKEKILEIAEELDTGTTLVAVNGKVYMVRNLVDSKFQPYAVLSLDLNRKSLMKSYSSIWGYKNVALYWNGELLMESGDGAKKQLPEQIVNQLKDGEGAYVYDLKMSNIYNKREMYGGTLIVAVAIDNKVTHTGMASMYFAFFLLLIFMVPLIIQTINFFNRKVTVPLRDLMTAANMVREGNLGVEIENKEDNEEFYHMKDSFNHMSSQLKAQFDKIYLEEVALRDAKIMALQSQINPHFLNNTLEIINWEARLNGNHKVSSMIEALSTMLGETMNRKEEQLHSVAEEMAYADAYLYIISQRFGSKFQCTKQIDESLLTVQVPRLIIQPIVENAVEHGTDAAKRTHLEIRLFKRRDGYLCIEVENNRCLKEEDKRKIERLLSQKTEPIGENRVSLGIRNVNQRIKMIYGDDCGLFIKQNKQNNTISTILIKTDTLIKQK